MKFAKQLGFALVVSCVASPLFGQPLGTELVVRASSPTFATYAPGDEQHLFVAERNGVIRALDLATGQYLADPLLDLRGEILLSGERGLLGLAFHPQFAENGQFFVYVSDDAINPGADHASYVRRYRTDPDSPLVALEESEETIIRFDQPQSNHNGGWIGFGPHDNLLYIATGDGGSGNDLGTGHTPQIGNSQDVTDNLLGKMLRIDVDGDDFPGNGNANYSVPADNPFVNLPGDDEIFSYGLRNPFRNAFDRANGDLYIGDVGQGQWEEIDFIAADSSGGENFGWRLREGFHATPSGNVGGPRPADNVDPIHEYPHGFGPNSGNSVTGGTVYRGPVAELQGHYLFADFITRNVWSFHYNGEQILDLENRLSDLEPDRGSLNQIVAFGEDAVGNVYLVELGGEIWRITGAAIPGDFNRDAVVDRDDLSILTSNYGLADSALPELGDADADTDVDGFDWMQTLLHFGRSANDVAAGSAGQNAVAAIPEPSTLWLASLALAGAGMWLRSGRG